METVSDSGPRHIVMLMLDAFRPDYLTLYDPPNLKRLMREGTWVAEARSVFPSTTTTNQTSFVTGAFPGSTGIPNNARYDRESDRILRPLRDNRCPTIAEILRDNGWTAASVNHFMLENRGADPYIRGSMEDVIGLFAGEGDPPGLVVYYHSHTDSVGHAFGPFSPEMREAVLAIDEDIGRLIDVLHAKGLADRTVVVVASDHGMVPNDGRPVDPPLEELAARLGLKVALSDEEIDADTELVALFFGCAFLYWREGKRTPEREHEVVEALSRARGLRVLRAEDIRALRADPERLGDIVLVPEEGWMIRKGSGTGGYHGPPFAGHSTMLFWGAGVRRGHVLHRASITDIVPTLLALAGVEVPPSVDGQVLTGVMDRAEDSPGSEMTPGAATEALDEVAAALDVDEHTAEATVTPEQLPYGAWRWDLDLGTVRRVKAVGVEAAVDAEAVGPSLYLLEVSANGEDYVDFAQGILEPVTAGQVAWIKTETPVAARYVRLVAYRGHAGREREVRVGRLLVTSDGEG